MIFFVFRTLSSKWIIIISSKVLLWPFREASLSNQLVEFAEKFPFLPSCRRQDRVLGHRPSPQVQESTTRVALLIVTILYIIGTYLNNLWILTSFLLLRLFYYVNFVWKISFSCHLEVLCIVSKYSSIFIP